MDQDFQTTFIPKKPAVDAGVPLATGGGNKSRRSRPMGILTLVATSIFIVAILAAAGVYFYGANQESSIINMREQLELAEKSFEPGLLEELQELNTRLSVAQQLLSRHIAIAPAFQLLEGITLRSVQFTQFSYDYQAGVAEVAMTGRARDYTAIAQQSSLFGESQFIEDHIFSNFAVLNTGEVSFDVKFTVDPNLIRFEESLGRLSES